MALLILALTIAQVLLALLGIALDPGVVADAGNPYYPGWVFLLHVLVFAASGGFLAVAGRRDRRAVLVGAAFWVIAATYARSFLLRAAFPPLLNGTATFLTWFYGNAFLPWLLWSFAGLFPRLEAPATGDRALRVMRIGTLGLGWLLFLTDPLLRLGGLVGPLEPVLRLLGQEGLLWGLTAVLQLLVFVVIPLRARRAAADERRRVRLLMAALLTGSLPVLIFLVGVTASPALDALVREPTPSVVVGLLVFPPLLLMPIASCYVVVRHRVLGIRLLIRKALRYALARYTTLAAAVVPLALLVVLLWQRRTESILDLLTGTSAITLLVLAVVALALLVLQRPLLGAIDRRFFREQYVAEETLQSLVRSARDVGSSRELALLVEDEIDRALHVETVGLLCRSGGDRLLSMTGRLPDLELSPMLRDQLLLAESPLIFEEASQSGSLDESDRSWQRACGAELIVPLMVRGELTGLIAVGPKKSELPFSREDRRLLQAVGSSSALALDNVIMRDSTASGGSQRGSAQQRPDHEPPTGATLYCDQCSAVHPPPRELCPRCGSRLKSAMVPYVLGGKFRMVRKLGSGGMGVVLEARDVELARRVAVKALPRTSPQKAALLRGEARAMASVSHPNLALIYGAESWRGTPILVLEYLGGGTLQDRLSQGPLEHDDVMDLAVTLASVLVRIHAAGVLHRDIKPSNIGYTEDGELKLLDFGLADLGSQVAGTGVVEPPDLPWDSETLELIGDETSGEFPISARQTLVTRKRRIVGTPAYLSPEAVRGERPSPFFDFWSLAVVVVEARLGKNPWLGNSLTDTLLRIAKTDAEEILGPYDEISGRFRSFLCRCLDRDPRRRPQAAGEMLSELEGIRAAGSA